MSFNITFPKKTVPSMIHVHQGFRAVGHGTFFLGLILSDDMTPEFSWVYDCGSKRTNRIDSEIREIENCRLWPQRIDLFVLSHFDDDHVNGVESFLRTRTVGCLVLPYMDPSHRLVQAASISGETCSASTALFQLDPMQWLSSRDLSDRVESILFVRGGLREEDDSPNIAERRPLPRGSEGVVAMAPELEVDQQFRSDYLKGELGGGVHSKMLLWKHATPMSVLSLPVEMMFFNSKQPDLFRQLTNGNRVARRSGVSVQVLQEEIYGIMRSYRLDALSMSPRRGWREALKGCYARHFGHSSQAKNNISLCLLVRPLVDIKPCSKFLCGNMELICPINRGGLLCLGDLRVDADTIKEMRDHFGIIRWSSLFAVQVPHHGSRHSWRSGNSTIFAPDYFVQCVPDKSIHHPHEEVNDDLHGYNIVAANYKHGVALDYHF